MEIIGSENLNAIGSGLNVLIALMLAGLFGSFVWAGWVFCQVNRVNESEVQPAGNNCVCECEP